MAGWHHWLDGSESEWTPGVGDGQGGLACCNSWGRKESDTTERLNWTELCKFWQLYGGVNGDLLQEGLCYTQVCCAESPHPCGSPLLTCTSTWDAQTLFYLSLCGVLRATKIKDGKYQVLARMSSTLTIKHCFVGCKMVQSFWKRVLHPPKMLSINLLCDPAITLQSVYKEAMKTYVHTKNCTWIFIAKETIQMSIKR